MDERLRQFVILRDGGCVARMVTSPLDLMRWPMLRGLPEPGPCRNAFGAFQDPHALQLLTVDHVKDRDRPSMGMKAPDDADHLWSLCHWHHIESSWATKVVVRNAAVEYILAANAYCKAVGWPPWPPEIAA